MKAFIITASVLVICVFAGSCYLIWMNRAIHNVLQIFGKVILMPALFAVVLLLYELYFTPVPHDTSATHVFLIHDYGTDTANLSLIVDWAANRPVGGYWQLNSAARDIKKHIPSARIEKKEAQAFYLDLVEATFWKWLFRNYAGHWDVERTTFHGISSWKGKAKPSSGAEGNPLQYSWHDIELLIQENTLFSALIKENNFIGTRWEDFIKFPNRTELSSIRQDSMRGIRFSNLYIRDFTCTISFIKEEQLDSSDFGKRIKELLLSTTGKDFTTACAFEVRFVCKYNPWFRWSPSSLRQKAWVNDMRKTFHGDFDWESIREVLLTQHNLANSANAKSRAAD